MILEKTSKRLGLSIGELSRFAATCPRRYKVFQIPKRRGGYRTIAQPSKAVKSIQTLLIRKEFGGLPIHESAKAYRRGVGIVENVREHCQNEYLLKMDFTNFFPSILPADFTNHLERHFSSPISSEDSQFLSGIFFFKDPSTRKLVLSVGAPSSPFISNTILFDFDTLVSSECKKLGVSYTRYADDLTFSTKTANILVEFPAIIAMTLSKISYPRLKINEQKTAHLSKKGRRQVTGLVITNSGSISIGRDRKRRVKALVHRFVCGSLNATEVAELQGLLWFINDVEPLFLDALKTKYGEPSISKIQQSSS